MAWQIQARNRHYGTQWEPISVERSTVLQDDTPERRFEYDTLAEAAAALAHLLEISDGLPSVVMRRVTGGRRYLDAYELRFVRTREAVPADTVEALAEIYANQAAIKRERASR